MRRKRKKDGKRGLPLFVDVLDWYDLEHEDQDASWQLPVSVGAGLF
jgi:hypothetical protein